MQLNTPEEPGTKTDGRNGVHPKLACKGKTGSPTRPSSHHKGDAFAPEEQRAGNKRQRQVVEDERKGEGNKEEGRGYTSGDKGLPLDRRDRLGT